MTRRQIQRVGIDTGSGLCGVRGHCALAGFIFCWIGAVHCGVPASAAETKAAPASDHDASLEQRLRTEAPKAWEELADYYHHVRGSYTLSWVYTPTDKAHERHDAGNIALNGDFVREIGPQQARKGTVERVLATNGVYAFALSRRAGDPKASFAIDQLEQLGANPNMDKRVAFLAGQTEAVVSWPWKIALLTLPEWEKTEGFAIKRVKRFGSGAHPMVEVDFEGMRFGPDKDPTILNGYVVFDPADHWVIQRLMTRWPLGGTRDATYEYGRHEDGFPILTKKVEKMGKPDKYCLQTEVLDIHHENVPQGEFYLSHYGLPEPDFRVGSRHSLFWLLIDVGLLLLVVSLIVWWRRTRAHA